MLLHSPLSHLLAVTSKVCLSRFIRLLLPRRVWRNFSQLYQTRHNRGHSPVVHLGDLTKILALAHLVAHLRIFGTSPGAEGVHGTLMFARLRLYQGQIARFSALTVCGRRQIELASSVSPVSGCVPFASARTIFNASSKSMATPPGCMVCAVSERNL